MAETIFEALRQGTDREEYERPNGNVDVYYSRYVVVRSTAKMTVDVHHKSRGWLIPFERSTRVRPGEERTFYFPRSGPVTLYWRLVIPVKMLSEDVRAGLDFLCYQHGKEAPSEILGQEHAEVIDLSAVPNGERT